jgi:hypothetical protein
MTTTMMRGWRFGWASTLRLDFGPSRPRRARPVDMLAQGPTTSLHRARASAESDPIPAVIDEAGAMEERAATPPQVSATGPMEGRVATPPWERATGLAEERDATPPRAPTMGPVEEKAGVPLQVPVTGRRGMRSQNRG